MLIFNSTFISVIRIAVIAKKATSEKMNKTELIITVEQRITAIIATCTTVTTHFIFYKH